MLLRCGGVNMPVTSAVVVQNVLKMAAIPDRKLRPSNLFVPHPPPPPPESHSFSFC